MKPNTPFPVNLYFLGIGGIGMSGLARFFLQRGHKVAGFDRTQSQLTDELEQEGALICYNDEIKNFPQGWEVENTLIIFTPAVKEDNRLLHMARRRGFNIQKRAEVLGRITAEMRCLAIAGTHGKTTTSSILAHLCHAAGYHTNAFLGGIANNFGNNYVLGEENTVVVEADEYDRSFLHLRPNIAVITNTDSDHLDIYGDAESMQKTFRDFAQLSRKNGLLISRYGIDLEADYTYGLHPKADFRAEKITPGKGGYTFNFHHPKGEITGVFFPVPGRHNLENAVAAMAVCVLEGLDLEKVAQGARSFQGVKRRFQKHLDEPVLIDDYAHHPTELSALIDAIEETYPKRKFALVFQPHLYSRTRDFLEEFASVLSRVPHPALIPVYPARETPDAGIESDAVFMKMNNPKKRLLTKENVAEWVAEVQPEVLVIAGAGDIELLIPSTKEALLTPKKHRTNEA
jgi:UDP-N-acetylmuramate--alanine ligase